MASLGAHRRRASRAAITLIGPRPTLCAGYRWQSSLLSALASRRPDSSRPTTLKNAALRRCCNCASIGDLRISRQRSVSPGRPWWIRRSMPRRESRSTSRIFAGSPTKRPQATGRSRRLAGRRPCRTTSALHSNRKTDSRSSKASTAPNSAREFPPRSAPTIRRSCCRFGSTAACLRSASTLRAIRLAGPSCSAHATPACRRRSSPPKPMWAVLAT